MALSEQEELEMLRLRKQKAQASGPEPRKTPKQMIGAEGFPGAMQDVMRSKGWLERNLAGVGAIPRQMYEGGKQAVGELVNAVRPKQVSDLIAPRKNQFEDRQAIQAARVMEEEAPVGALAGGLSLAALAPGSVLGQAVAGGAMGALQPTEEGESRGKNALLGLTVAGGAAGAMKGAGMAASKLFGAATTKATDTAAQQAVRDKTLAEARTLGLNVPPTVAGGGKVAKGLESVAGKAAVAQEASIRNQHVIDHIARTESGLKPNEPITEGTLAKAREVMAQPYREIAALSPKAKAALDDLKEARLDSKDAWKKYGGPSGGPAERREALAADSKVSKLEKLIDIEATKAGRVDLLPALKKARIAIAKNHDVESALNIGSGSVDASKIGRILDRRGEKAVTGGLQTIGKFQQAFPDFARIRPSGQSSPGVGYLKYPLALGLGAEGYNFGQQHGIGPYGTAAGLLALAGGPARSIALSKLMQSAPKYQPGMAVRLADIATNDPRMRAMIPLSAAGATLGGSNTQ